MVDTQAVRVTLTKVGRILAIVLMPHVLLCILCDQVTTQGKKPAFLSLFQSRFFIFQIILGD